MYIQIIEAIFDSIKVYIGLTKKPDISKEIPHDHSYERLLMEYRGPCPGLNMLANHGYLPRDGKDISHDRLIAALMCTKMTATWATIISNPIFSTLGHDGKFDLRDLRKHNILEHDASLSRLDFKQGDNYTCQKNMVEDLIKDAKGGPITLQTLAATRARRDREHKRDGNEHIPLYLHTAALLEAGGLLGFWGDSVDPETIRTFFYEERMLEPDNPGAQKVTVWLNLKTALKLWWNIKLDKGK
ncbi:Chloroperoxidase [Xylogone sp. PMI_703]|nr:Chloroperoxidase [Xylogone sp. PMI_703]